MSILFKTIKELFGRSQLSVATSHNSLSNIEYLRQAHGGSVLCFVGGSEGNALANLTKELMEPIAGKASKIWILNVASDNFLVELNQALRDPVWFVFSFFAIGQEINIEVNGHSKNIWETFRIPFFRLFGDIPAYFPDRHIRKYNNSINGYGDASHFDFYRRWFDDKALTILLPSIALETKPLSEVDENLKYRGSIIFPKNGNSPPKLIDYWRNSLPITMARILESVAEECISQSNINHELFIDTRLIQAYSKVGIDVSADKPLLCFLVAQIDDYVRRIKSTMVAEAILDLPVIVQGVNWEHVNFSGKRARLNKSSDYVTTSSMFDSSLALIDMSPNTLNMPHDRICRAAGHGTAFITNKQNFIKSIVPDSSKCEFLFTKNSIHDLVEYYVLNPRDAIGLGLQQAQNFRAYYTWERYEDALISAVDAMAMRLSGRPYGTQNFVNFPPVDYH